MLLDRRKVRFWQKIVFSFMAFLMVVFIAVGLGGIGQLTGCESSTGSTTSLDDEIAVLKQRIAASPGDLEARLELAESLRRRAGQAVQGQEQRDEYLRASADAYDAYVKRLARTKGTKAELREAERLQISALEDMVGVYRTLGDFEAITRIYGRLTDLRPGNARYFYDMGRVAVTAGDTATAQLAFGRYLDLAPDSPEAANVRDWLAQNASGGAEQ